MFTWRLREWKSCCRMFYFYLSRAKYSFHFRNSSEGSGCLRSPGGISLRAISDLHRTWTRRSDRGSGLLDYVARTISIPRADRCWWIRETLDEQEEREGVDEMTRWRRRLAKKKARRQAGNRVRVEFALTRPVLASGVVARLVARRRKLELTKPTTIPKCIATDRIAERTRKYTKSTPTVFNVHVSRACRRFPTVNT